MSFQNQLQTILITLLLGAILHKANAGPDNIAYKAKATGSASIDDNAKPPLSKCCWDLFSRLPVKFQFKGSPLLKQRQGKMSGM